MSQDSFHNTSTSYSSNPGEDGGGSRRIPGGAVTTVISSPMQPIKFKPTPSERRDLLARLTLLASAILFLLSLGAVVLITLWGTCEDINKRFDVVFPIFEKTIQTLMPIALLVIGFYFSNKNDTNDDKSES